MSVNEKPGHARLLHFRHPVTVGLTDTEIRQLIVEMRTPIPMPWGGFMDRMPSTAVAIERLLDAEGGATEGES